MHKNDIDFDIVDDLLQFINNDTTFYKEVFYPIVQKIENHHKYNLPINKALLVPVVKRAYDVYKDVYDLDQLPEKLSPEDLSDICNQLYQQESDKLEKDNSPDSPSSPLTDSVSEEINHIAKLAGIGNGSNTFTPVTLEHINNKAAANAEYVKENNIKPGTKEWFDTWFPLDTSRFPTGFRGRK